MLNYKCLIFRNFVKRQNKFQNGYLESTLISAWPYFCSFLFVQNYCLELVPIESDKFCMVRCNRGYDLYLYLDRYTKP